MANTKKCAACKKVKPLSEFYKNKQQKDEHHSYCKECHKWQQKYKWPMDSDKKKLMIKRYASSEHGKNIIRNWQYKNNYGITLEQYNKMFKKQKGVCYICGNENQINKKLCVDHDHKTGRVRGLLCYGCNRSIGWAEKRLDFVLKYLRENNE